MSVLGDLTKEYQDLNEENVRLRGQITILTKFIAKEVPGEAVTGELAVETAIKVIRKLHAELAITKRAPTTGQRFGKTASGGRVEIRTPLDRKNEA
jgi:hypothetical protein